MIKVDSKFSGILLAEIAHLNLSRALMTDPPLSSFFVDVQERLYSVWVLLSDDIQIQIESQSCLSILPEEDVLASRLDGGRGCGSLANQVPEGDVHRR